MQDKISSLLVHAKSLLDGVKNQSLSEPLREKKAIELASLILEGANKIQDPAERRAQKEIARMMQDPRGKAFTMMMTDECFRSNHTARIANQLIYLLRQFGIPHYVDWLKRIQLSLFQLFGKPFHFLLVPLAKQALRKTTSRVILPGERAALSRHMAHRRTERVRLNLNHLGEAILGEEEAARRLKVYSHDLEQDDIEYISIKISTIYSQISTLDWEGTIHILADRLKQLYRKSMEHTFQRADGTRAHKFVNLDMEEYKDLHLTKELFQRVLDEKEFMSLSAGIVLQAYIPDSFLIQQELTQWAMQRRSRGGAPIKIRIVKGANLAMEQVEASLRHWEQTPYKTKLEVDANYKRMVVYGSKKAHAEAVHLGIASHNLFDIAYAMLLRAEHGVEKEVSFEMLEGMADHMRKIVQQLTGDILLYCPVATKEDFQSAIAYLIRRLDENTGPENFLRHSFGLRAGTEAWKEQVALFSKACSMMDRASFQPRRTQNRFDPPERLSLDEPYQGDADTDFALLQNQKWAHQLVKTWQTQSIAPIPLVIDGKEIEKEQKGQGVDPSNPHATSYRYSLATWDDINHAIQAAKKHEASWKSTPVHKRAELIAAVAQKLREKRGDLIGVMMRDGGKTVYEADPEVTEAIDFAEYYLRNMLELDKMKEIEFSPLGTILVTPPWNFPISIPAGGILAALVTGNCVLFKPAPEAVLSGWALVNLFWEAGIPKTVLQFINCVDDPVGSQLIKDERIDAVILTGGTSTARLFMQLRPTLSLCAETGGKNAIIVTSMADRDLAIKDIVHSAFGHSGQKCSAASLLILEAEVYDDPHFQKQLKDAVESLKVGSCWQLSTKVVPTINAPSGALLKGLTTLEKGERWLVQPKQNAQNPHLFSPGVKWGVVENSFMHQTELFGPVLGVMRAKNLDEALRLVNGTPYGLTSGIHTLDKREIHLWLQKIVAGNCYINRGITGAIVERQPFGGCKASSFGHGSKAGGPNYILQFMHKTQKEIPVEKTACAPSINALTPFLEEISLSTEELGVWFASIAGYTHWAKYFHKDHDPSKLVGQDNLLRYRPRTHMALRMQAHDKPLDLFRILAAATSVKAHLEVSYDPSHCPVKITEKWRQTLPHFTFVPETESEFLDRLKEGVFERVRLASKPSKEMYLAASVKTVYLNKEPVLASGRLELLHYIREMAISIDYHRYGNLGLREGESRSAIL